MSDVIKLLPESVANQIAAGEVVQRPASVIKELVENSIDAEATHIQIIVKDAGKLLIQVIDDGKGMSETDARMCFERHATSKITKSEDLFSIMTKGFRGEAMASIAAVAQVELKTKQREEEALGTKIKIEASVLKEHTEEVCTNGSSISVRNLFFNVPARRNFLKSNAVEMRHITEEVQRLALSHPQINFELYHNDLPIFNLSKGKLGQRIVAIFGKNYNSQLATIQEETPDIKIYGYIGRPEFAKKTRGEQYFFVNNRFIKSPALHHAVSSAYQEIIAKDAYPFYVIFIELDPKTIDINVHPTKTEIKFDDDRLIYAILNSAVKKSLGINSLAHSLDFGSDANTIFSVENSLREKANETNSKSYNPQNFSKPQTDGWQQLFDGMENVKNEPTQEHLFENNSTFSSKINEVTEENPLERGGTVMQILNKYIVSQIKSGMLIIDQNLAHERILYERYISTLEKKFGASQQFLFPQTIELSPSDYVLVKELEADIKNLGFVFNDFGKNTIVLNGIPSDAPSGNEKEVFEGLLQSYKDNESLNLKTNENLARSLAKRSAIKSGSKLNKEEMNVVIDELFACKTPEFALDGNKTMSILKEIDLLKFLK